MPLAILLLLLQATAGQDLLQRLEKEAPIRPPLTPHAVEDALERRVEAAVNRLPHPSTKAAITAARPELRKRLTESLGLASMPWPPDLRATTLGTVPGTGYRIEKVAYQTLPNLLVPALVYIPQDWKTAAPAILIAPSSQAKSVPELQSLASNLARRGFIVLIADPFGQGERRPVSEQTLRDALLAGLSLPGIAEYETRCALEYLRSRNDVDAARLGLAANGISAWTSAALDERLAAVVIVDGIFDIGDLVHALRDSDWNQGSGRFDLIPGILQYANVQDLTGLVAPRPVLMIAPATARPLHDLGKTAYAAFDKADDIQLFEDGGYTYSPARREAAYGFFLRALMQEGDGSPQPEPQTPEPLHNPADLACLPGGQLAPVTDAIQELAGKFASDSAPVPPAALAGREPDWGNVNWRINAFPIHRLNLKSEIGIETPVTILRPHPRDAGGNTGTLLAIDDQDKESLTQDPVVLEALKRDYMVVEMDPRGFGELSVQHPAWVSAASLLLGENFAWRQGWDIARLLDVFERRPGHIRAVYAHGPKAALAATYALWLLRSQDIDWAVLRGGLSSLRQLPGNAAMPEWTFSFGAFRSQDIPQLLAATKTRIFASLESFLSADW